MSAKAPARRKPCRKTRTFKLKAEPRDYEAEFAAALAALGFNVITWAEWQGLEKTGGAPARTVVCQYQPRLRDPYTGRRHSYRLDFACPECRCNAEIDGFHGKNSRVGGHTSWTGFNSDRLRDQAMLLAGWRVMRFGPAQLRDLAAVGRAAELWARLIGMCREGDVK